MNIVAALVFLFWFAFWLGMVGISLYGIYLGFCAGIILGVVSLFIQPAPLVYGVGMVFFHVNLPVLLMQWISHHAN